MVTNWPLIVMLASTIIAMGVAHIVRVNHLKRVIELNSKSYESLLQHADYMHSVADRYIEMFAKLKDEAARNISDMNQLRSMYTYIQEDNQTLIEELLNRNREDNDEEDDWKIS